MAEKLRELRKRAGLTGDRLARRCNMSQSQISKFETGKKTPKLVDVERILRALDAPPELVADILVMARIANTEWQGKRSSWRRGTEKRQAELAALEADLEGEPCVKPISTASPSTVPSSRRPAGATPIPTASPV
ncbi:helix-turn-helix domain-containing protein [Streptomyces sp. NPDC001530]|uniref:helix-turn-helix domain-containing protein n=1 Tax=Streptomyces sp. NPDC001530 TaxID=3364582 RepID=UPI0036C643C2